jgi:hypothetical protein
MSMSPPERFVDRCEQLMPHDWEERVARAVQFQARIEVAFDRADACERLGDLAHALDWLDRASALSGGLSPTYKTRRAHFARVLDGAPEFHG